MNPFDFFQRRVCLTLGHDWALACKEFERVGIENVWRFDALPIDGEVIKGPHQSFSASLRQILEDFLVSGASSLLHMEDDVVFRDHGHLRQALAELPSDWDVVYLGANLLCWGRDADPQPQRYSPHLFRVSQAWCTHAVGFSRRVAGLLVANQPPLDEQMFDNYLSAQLQSLKAYVVAPMVAYQRHHPSAIWGTNEDYTHLFEASERKLK